MLGIDGPACGGTRMARYLMHGDIMQADRHHLAALIALPFATYGLAAWTAAAIFRRALPALRIPRWAWWAYAAFFVLYTVVLRNLLCRRSAGTPVALR
jgi:Protein of unknown function (DUF2752)